MVPTTTKKKRCEWSGDRPLYVAYHDDEWGVPVHDDHRLFEFLLLEGAQAGLSWWTILQKRENYRAAFAQFDPRRVSRFSKIKTDKLLENSGIVRNRLKIESAITNAQQFLDVQSEFGSFDQYLWAFVSGEPIQNRWRHHSKVPAVTELADTLSRDLIKRGFKFVGPTICYAYMQAIGMVNDHVVPCFRHREVARLR